ncbi:MAG: lipid II flippase MurJ [Bacillota bacterium]|nr:lipid II flippase MurJ [Bacillota bacterium]
MFNIKKVFSTSVTLILLAVITRLLGFIREIIIAYYFGTSSLVDLYVSSQILGELVGNVILVGSFSTYTVLALNKNGDGIFKKVQYIGTCISVILVMFIILNKSTIANFISLGSNPYEIELLTQYIIYLAPTIVMLTITSIFNGYLQYKRNFLHPVVAIIYMNIGFIISVFILKGVGEQYILPISYLISIIIYLIYSSSVYICFKKKRTIVKNSNIDSYKNIFSELMPIIITMTVMKVTLITDRMFGGLLEEGQLASYNYSLKLMNLPVAIIATSLINIMFVNFSKSRNENELGLQYTDLLLKLSIFVSIFTFGFSQELVSLIFGYGEFGEKAIIMTGAILKLLAITIPLQFIYMFYNKVVYAVLTSRIIMFVSIIGIIVNIFINILLVPVMGVKAIVLSTILSLSIQCIIYNKLVLGIAMPWFNKGTLILTASLLLVISSLKLISFDNDINLVICLLLYTASFYLIDKIIKQNVIRKVMKLGDYKVN